MKSMNLTNIKLDKQDKSLKQGNLLSQWLYNLGEVLF